MERKKNKKDDLHPGNDVIPKPLPLGRKRIEIDLEQLQALARLRPSLADVAAFFKISEDTVTQIIKREFNKNFTVYIEEQVVHTKSALMRKALGEALKKEPNTKMLDLCLKNFCGWRDRIENDIHAQVALSHAPTVVFAVNNNDDDE